MTWQPKLRPKGFPHSLDDFALASLTELEHRSRTGEDKRDQRVFRVKRKHVLKACDRCRVKKTKCDGKQPCNRCSVYNHPCLFRERKATQTKVYSRGFVEMLESHHALVVKALQKLYKFCINKEGFPGEPLAEAPDGHPLTHTILDRLGLIKQAEENADEVDEDSEDLRYLRILSTSTECSVTAEPSPEPTTPTEPSPTTSSRASVCQGILTPMTSRNNSTWQWDMQATQQTNLSYPGNGFPGFFAPARPSIGSADSSSGDVFSHIDNSSPSILSHHPPRHDQQLLTYFLDPASNIASSSSIESKSVDRYNQGFHISETHSHAAATLPGDVWTDFNFPTHDQALYETFTPSWSFPSA